MMADLPIVRKVGEGVDKPNAEQELPLDINYKGLIEWLVTRQKLPKDWHKRVQAINAKATDAIKDAQSAAVLSSLEGGGADAPLDYFRAVAIMDALSAKCEKTMFGGLTGPAAVWNKIVKAYQNNSVFLGEAAQTMVQNVVYEIPILRKQAARVDQQVTDCERKHAEYIKSAAQCQASFEQECKKLGIIGTDVRGSLRALCSQLPDHLGQLLVQLESEGLAGACSYYRAFSEYAHSMPAEEAMLPTLSEIREGRTQPPAAAEHEAPPVAATSKASQPAPDLDIDWGMDLGASDAAAAPPAGDINWDLDLGTAGDGDTAGLAPGAIDWDLDLDLGASGAEAAEAAAPAEISWDLDLGTTAGTGGANDAAPAAADVDWNIEADAGGADAPTAPAGINWDIDLSDTGAAPGAGGGNAPALDIDWDVSGVDAPEVHQGQAAHSGQHEEEARGVEGGPAGVSGRDAALLRLERDADYRGRLLDDLQELRAFLVQRKAELRSSSTELLPALLPDAVQSVDASAVGSFLSAVEAALAAATSERLRQLLMIKSSASYFARLASSLERKAGQEARMLSAAQEAEKRKREARAQLATLAPRVAELVTRTRSIKAEAERALSAAFGRRVNILGDINTVLASTGL